MFDKPFKNLVRTPKERKIKSWLRNHPSGELLFHHRFPTSTANVYNACHPFTTRKFFKTDDGKGTQYILVHNGWITNDDELKKEHEKLGIAYQSVQPNGDFNDSEALLWDVALYLEGKQDQLNARGHIAFICMALNAKGDKLYFGRNLNPLNMQLTEEGVFLSSEGEGEPIEADQLYEFNYKTKKVTHKPLDIPAYVSYVNSSVCGYNPEFDWRSWDGEDDFEYPVSREKFIRPSEIVAEYSLEAKDTIDERQHDIQTRYREYIDSCEGIIATACNKANDDLDWLSLMLDMKHEEEEDPDLNLEYEIEIQESVIQIMMDSPFWVDSTSLDPNYVRETAKTEKPRHTAPELTVETPEVPKNQLILPGVTHQVPQSTDKSVAQIVTSRYLNREVA